MFTFLKSIIYGFVLGCAQILPISSRAHKSILLKLFGMETSVPFSDLMIHIGLLAALLYVCNPGVNKIRKEFKTLSRGKGRAYKSSTYFDFKLLKAAMIPMLLGMILMWTTETLSGKLLYVALFLLINGAVLFLQDHASQGNKNASHFSKLESILLGLSGALSFLPGISRTGMMLSVGMLRGADREKVVDWVLLLTIPALILLCVFDIVVIISAGFGISSFLVFLYCLVSGITAFIGGYFAIRTLKALTVISGFSAFSYYSWGAALFCVVLYLIS